MHMHAHVHRYADTHVHICTHMHTQTHTSPAHAPGRVTSYPPWEQDSVSWPSQYFPAQAGTPDPGHTPVGSAIPSRPAPIGKSRQWRGNALPATTVPALPTSRAWQAGATSGGHPSAPPARTPSARPRLAGSSQPGEGERLSWAAWGHSGVSAVVPRLCSPAEHQAAGQRALPLSALRGLAPDGAADRLGVRGPPLRAGTIFLFERPAVNSPDETLPVKTGHGRCSRHVLGVHTCSCQVTSDGTKRVTCGCHM